MKKLFASALLLGLISTSALADSSLTERPASLSSTSLDSLPLAYWAGLPEQQHWAELLASPFAAFDAYWQLGSGHLYAVELNNLAGQPIANARVQLLGPQGEVHWEAMTNLRGQARLWAQQPGQGQRIVAAYGQQQVRLDRPSPLPQSVNAMKLDAPCQVLEGADIRFLLDATHSMQDEFPQLRSALQATGRPILLGRDLGERFLIQALDSATEPGFALRAAGGGDDEEAIDSLLSAALAYCDWDEQATVRQLIYITDALPMRHTGAPERLQGAIRLAAQYGVALVPVAASGINAEGAYVLQSLAWLTNGHYAWLEDAPGNIEFHRRPLLPGPHPKAGFAEWLDLQLAQSAAFNTCADLAPPASIALDEAIRCFPNPAKGQTTVVLPHSAQTLSLYNSEGRLLKQWVPDSFPEFAIPLEEWPAGQYWVEVLTASGPLRTGLVLAR